MEHGRIEYGELIAAAARLVEARELAAARRLAELAVGQDRSRPEAYNLLGVLEESRGHRLEAQRLYRIALEVQPAFAAAQQNLHRSTQAPGLARGRLRW